MLTEKFSSGAIRAMVVPLTAALLTGVVVGAALFHNCDGNRATLPHSAPVAATKVTSAPREARRSSPQPSRIVEYKRPPPLSSKPAGAALVHHDIATAGFDDGELFPDLAELRARHLRPFFLYDPPGDDVVGASNLDAYRAQHGMDPWFHDERVHVAEHTNRILFDVAVSKHAMRVLDGNKAETFVIPTGIVENGVTSATAGKEAKDVAQMVTTHDWFWRFNGADHVTFSGHFGCAQQKSLKRLIELSRNMTVLSADTWWCCGTYPRNVVSAPYTAHGLLVAWRLNPVEQARPRESTFFFQGNAGRHYRAGVVNRAHIIQQFQQHAGEASLMVDTKFVVNKHLDDDPSAKNEAIQDYARRMLGSKYCLMVHGDSPTSRRLYDALAAGCVPIIIDDPLLATGNLPLSPWLPWHKIAVMVRYRLMRADPECVIRTLLEIPEERYLSYRRHGNAAWRELSFCAAGSPDTGCKAQGRAVDNLLAAAHLASQNHTAYAERVRLLLDAYPFYEMPNCKQGDLRADAARLPFQTRGLVNEDHTCRRTPRKDDSRIMTSRTLCFCEPGEPNGKPFEVKS